MKQTVKKSDVVKLIQSELRTFNKIKGKKNLNEKFLGIGYPTGIGVVGQSGRKLKKVDVADTLPNAKRSRKSTKSLKEGRMNRHDMNDILVEFLGEEGALDAIVRAMSDDDFKDIFEYITRMHEIEY